jgi:hypothetical protein
MRSVILAFAVVLFCNFSTAEAGGRPYVVGYPVPVAVPVAPVYVPVAVPVYRPVPVPVAVPVAPLYGNEFFVPATTSVRAPFVGVDTGFGFTSVRAPFVRVETGPGGTFVRAPFVRVFSPRW